MPHRNLALLIVLSILAPGSLSAAEPVTPPDREDFLIFLLAGQSNMAGRGKPLEKQDQTPHRRVLVLNQDGQWTPAVDPLHWDKPAVIGVGLGLTFGKTLAAALPGKTIGLVPAAFGGSQISEWARGAHRYADAVKRCNVALRQGTLAGILWHQGEADAKTAERAGLYQQRVDELVANLRSDLAAPDVPFIAGTLADTQASAEAATVNAALKTLSKRLANTACAEAKGLTMAADGIHFDPASYRELGRRYAAVWRRVQPSPPAEQ